MFRVVNCWLPGSTRSGENARKKSASAFSPPASSIGCTTSSVVPGYVVDSSMTSCPGLQRRRHGLHRLDDVGEIRVLGLAERRRDADVDDVHLPEPPHVGGRGQLPRLHDRGDLGVGDVGDVALPGVDLRRLRLVDVEAGDRKALARELDRQRQADVAEADDADARLPGGDAVEERPRVSGGHGVRVGIDRDA